MLKFFRVYNKYILVAGMTLLMIAFLIQPVISMFMPSDDNQVIGRLAGEKIRRRDVQSAEEELKMLERLSPLLAATINSNEAQWMLLIRETKRLGLSASSMEVNNLLVFLGIDEATQNRLAEPVGATADYIKQIVRHWIMVDTYRQLTLGELHTEPLTRLDILNDIARQAPHYVPFYVNRLGLQHLSESFIRRYIIDHQARIHGKLVMVSADELVDSLDTPEESKLQAQFEKYANDAPGTGEPYGFGYRVAAGVKIETLSISFDSVLNSIIIDEVDALAHFKKNASQFTDDQGQPQDYDAVRRQIIDSLTQQQAQTKINLMIRQARAVLLEAPQQRALAKQHRYKIIPEGYTPLSLRVVADTLEQKTGIRPTLRYKKDDWTPVDRLVELEGIGFSTLVDRREISFANYVLSAREMDPSDDNPLTGLRLQVAVVSDPMRSFDQSRHLFRLVAAEPAHALENLDEIREQVTTDLQKLRAYEQLIEQADVWKTQAQNGDLTTLAEQLSVSELTLEDVSRSTGWGGLDPLLSSPDLLGIGRDASFIKAAFTLADELNGQDKSIGDLDLDLRIIVVPIAAKLSLAVFRLDGYDPMTQAEFEAEARKPAAQVQVSRSLLANSQPDPLAYDAMVKRVGYKSEGDRDTEDEEEADAQTATTP